MFFFILLLISLFNSTLIPNANLCRLLLAPALQNWWTFARTFLWRRATHASISWHLNTWLDESFDGEKLIDANDPATWKVDSWRHDEKKKMKRIVTMELWWLMKEHPSKPDDDSSISTSNSISKLNLIRELSLFPCCALVFGFDIDSHLLFYWRYNPKSSQIEFEGCWHYVFDRKYDISSRKW